MAYISFLLFGALGGLARGMIGAMKDFNTGHKAKSLDWKKIAFNVLGSVIIGSVVGMIVDTNPVLSLTSGYVGIDIVDSIIKVTKK